MRCCLLMLTQFVPVLTLCLVSFSIIVAADCFAVELHGSCLLAELTGWDGHMVKYTSLIQSLLFYQIA